MTDAFLYNYLSLWATTWLWIFRVFAVESGDFFCHLNYGRKTRPSQTKKWKEILLSIQARRDQHWNPNTLPLCGPVRWSLKCCHDGLALSAQRRPTDALPRGRARGEQGSGPGASSALPRIQIGQCAVGKEGLRDTHTRTHWPWTRRGLASWIPPLAMMGRAIWCQCGEVKQAYECAHIHGHTHTEDMTLFYGQEIRGWTWTSCQWPLLLVLVWTHKLSRRPYVVRLA